MFYLSFHCLERCLVTWPNRDRGYVTVTVSRHVAAAIAGGYQAQDHMFFVHKSVVSGVLDG